MKRWLVAAAAMVVWSNSAGAAVVTKTIKVTASGFSAFANPSAVAPYSYVSITFGITFDTSVDASHSKSGLTIYDFSLAGFFPAIEYTYSKSSGLFGLGTNAHDGYFVFGDPNSFGLSIYNIRVDNPSLNVVGYSASSGPSFSSGYGPSSTTIEALPNVTVPEPATWAMFIGGFGLMGATMRRNQKVAVTFA